MKTALTSLSVLVFGVILTLFLSMAHGDYTFQSITERGYLTFQYPNGKYRTDAFNNIYAFSHQVIDTTGQGIAPTGSYTYYDGAASDSVCLYYWENIDASMYFFVETTGTDSTFSHPQYSRMGQKMAPPASVDSAAVVAGVVNTVHLADSLISASKYVKSGTLLGKHFQAGTITETKLANDAVTTNKIADEAITPAKMDSSESFAMGGLRINTDNFAMTVAGDSVAATGSIVYIGDVTVGSTLVVLGGAEVYGDVQLLGPELGGYSLRLDIPMCATDGVINATSSFRTSAGLWADTYLHVDGAAALDSSVTLGTDAADSTTFAAYCPRFEHSVEVDGNADIGGTLLAEGATTLNGTAAIGNGDADSTTFAAYMPRTEHHFKVGQDLTVAGGITQHAGGGVCTFGDIDVLTNIDTATLTATGNIQGVDVTATDDLECTDQCTVGGALRVDGATQCNGIVGLGNASSDSITVTGGTRFVNDVEFDAGVSFEDGPANSVLGSDGVWRLLVQGWQVFTDSYAHLSYSDTRIAIPITGCAAGYYSNARVCDVDDSHDYDRVVQSYTKAGTLVVVMDAAVTATGYSISYEAAEPNHP